MSEMKSYEPPLMNVVYFEVKNIITTSAGGGGIELPDHDWE